MSKRNKIIYWIATIWLSLGMLSSGIVQLLRIEEEVDYILKMGYPVFFLTILGVLKIIGVAVILIPKFPLVKEWAYAGFFFTMSGAVYSHIAAGNSPNEIFAPLGLLILTVISWYSRPASRKLVLAH